MLLPSLPSLSQRPYSIGASQFLDNTHTDLSHLCLDTSRFYIDRRFCNLELPVVGSRAPSKTKFRSSGHVDKATTFSSIAPSRANNHIRMPLRKALKKAAILLEREPEELADVAERKKEELADVVEREPELLDVAERKPDELADVVVGPVSARTTHVLKDPRPPKEGLSASRTRFMGRRRCKPVVADVGLKLVGYLEFMDCVRARVIYREANRIRQARLPNETNNSPFEVLKSTCMDIRAAVRRYLIMSKVTSFMWEKVKRRAPSRQPLRVMKTQSSPF